MPRRAKYQTLEARREAKRASDRLCRARKKAAKEAQNIEALQPEPIEYPHLEESALRINGPSSSLHVTSTTIHPNLHPRDISKLLTTPPLSIRLSSESTDPVKQTAKVAATHVAQGKITGVEELTQAPRGQTSDEQKARKAARRWRYRARRKASRMKNRVGLLGVLQATIQRHLPAILLRGGGTLFQSGTRMIRNMSGWFPKLRYCTNQKALRCKTMVSN